MHPFQDFATARFVVFCTERVAPVVLSRQQNAILRRGCCKRHSSHRQERTCWGMWIAPARVEPVAFRAPANFARELVAARADVPSSLPRTKSKQRQQRGRSLTATSFCGVLLHS